MAEQGSIDVFSRKRKLTRSSQQAAERPAGKHRVFSPEFNDSKLIDSEATATPPQQRSTGAAVKLLDEQEVPLTGFRELGVSEWLDRVCNSLGMTRPTAVQTGCIRAILEGKDVFGTAHTGSGKTAAFALPILQKLAEEPFGVFALVLSPTRELAIQLADQFRALGAGMSLQDAVLIGGLDMQKQATALAKRPHVVIATPGRLRDLLQNEAGIAQCFSRVRFLVLDEADRLLEPSFESELRVIGRALPPKRQTLLFSATMTKSLVAMQTALLKDAFCFQVRSGKRAGVRNNRSKAFSPVKSVHSVVAVGHSILYTQDADRGNIQYADQTIRGATVKQFCEGLRKAKGSLFRVAQFEWSQMSLPGKLTAASKHSYEGLQTAKNLREEYLFIPAKVKEVYLFHLLSSLEALEVRSVIVFVGTCKACHLLDLMLEELGVESVSLHSHKPQGRRLAALDRFKSGSVSILLATDVASRGLDIASVDLVVNFDLPVLAQDYVHRVGRTARAMREGWALSFVSQYDLELVQKIEKLIGHQLARYEMSERDVLKGITRVYKARRAAAMRKAERDANDERRGKTPMQKRRKLVAAAAQ